MTEFAESAKPESDLEWLERKALAIMCSRGQTPSEADAALVRRFAEFLAAKPPSSITCPICGMRSYHPKDIEQGYCGNCHDWTSR